MPANAVIHRGFTLIELLIVLAVLSILLAIAVPRYTDSLKRGEEAVLRQNLALLRESIDKHYADHGRYPETLSDLVGKRYLRTIPVDPVAGSDSAWRLVPPPPPLGGRVYDVKSGAPGNGRDGKPYAEW